MADLTNFYFPGGESIFGLENEEIESQDSEDEKYEEDGNSSPSYHIYGFIGAEENDISYLSVLEEMDYDIRFDTDKVEVEEEKQSPIEKAVERYRSPMFNVRKEPIPVTSKAEIILNCCFKKVPIRKEAEKANLSVMTIKNLIYEFKVVRRVTRKSRKAVNLNRAKFTQAHSRILANFVESKRVTGFTSSEARNHIIQSVPELESISESTIKRHLHTDLKLCFKKLGTINPKKAGNESKFSLTMWLKVVLGLLSTDTHLLYVDEFLINRNTINTYGWTQKGRPGRLLVKPSNFRMSFVVAHSQLGVEGIMGTKSTFNQMKYVRFLKNLFDKLKRDANYHPSKVAIIWDNCRFHRTAKVKNFINKNKLKWIFIPPYSPEINSWEKLINMIKRFVKSEVQQQRYLS